MRRSSVFHSILKDLTGVYVEIGTCWGGFTEWLKHHTAATTIITIDPYRKFTSGYEDALNEMSQAEMDKKFSIVVSRLLPLGILMMRETSYKASKAFKDQSLSFCYIDGNHSYSAVLVDLTVWWPKIKSGGYLCGDDVEDITKPHDDEGNLFIQHEFGGHGKYGVHQALVDFAKLVPSFQYQIIDNQFVAKKP